jgi:hypothetical protein
MFKSLSSGFSRFFTNQKILILVIFIILAWGLTYYSGEKTGIIDRMENGTPVGAGAGAKVDDSSKAVPPPSAGDAKALPNPQSAASGQSSGGYALQPVTNPTDLLPQDQNSQWANLNPGISGSSAGGPAMPDLLQAGYQIGLDTIGQTLRNPNYQLRSDPIIPKQEIGPWNMSTIEPDIGRVPLEIGDGAK